MPFCPNCGNQLAGAYCHHCGQRDAELNVTVKQYVAELAREQLGWDARLPRTLRALLLKPGLLTTEWLAGRRASYVPPVRLYLWIAVVFFTLLTFAVNEGLRAEFTLPGQGEAGSGLLSRLQNDPEFLRLVSQSMTRIYPYAMFLALPLFALALRVLFRKSPIYYMGHLVFAFHVYSFIFLLYIPMLPLMALGQSTLGSVLSAAGALLMYGYLFLAMRRVYANGRLLTLVKLITVFAFDSVVRIVIALGVVFFLMTF